jgi:hypothetical protein
MKMIKVLCFSIVAAFFAVGNLQAQFGSGMSLSGATGLYSIPTGRIGWERSGPAASGFDFGYHAIISSGRAAHIPKFAFSLFNTLELSAAFDIQPQHHPNAFIGGMKVQLPSRRTAIALGGNYQAINIGGDERTISAGQIYLAVTYAGNFFHLPAETTIVFGKTFREGRQTSNIDFGMGFDMQLFPNVFEGLLHWITDFANFSYSIRPFRADAWHRGVLNTGIRLNFSTIPAFTRVRFMAAIMLVDAFDSNRAFAMGATFGVPLR